MIGEILAMEKNLIKKIVQKAVALVTSSDPYEWPPSCIVFTYQPVRPKQKNLQCEKPDTSESKEEM